MNQNEPVVTDLMNFLETCEYLKMKPSRIYSEVFRKRIPHIKIGRSLRFKKSELEKWIEEQTITPAKG